MQSFLDHIAVVAPDLASGTRFVEQALGVSLQAGGQHPRMGTHNKLLRLGDDVYLEVIAADPDAPAPQRARWFELDRMTPASTPRLGTWVIRTDDIVAAQAACSWETGPIESMTRGALAWRITIPEDGSLPESGVAPTLIQWDVPSHPASMLDDRGCTLQALELCHSAPERVRDALDALNLLNSKVQVRALPTGASPYLVAHIRTPHGLRLLSTDFSA
ncbi:VOC family protein [Bordetella muralis]|uniref:VOC family protein n=1 Tax=Bordetella muralis TaxID=1649130 RepID=UPI0039EF2DFC